MCSNVLDPMAQDISEQDIVMGELELPPQMDPKPEMGAAAEEAAVYDTSPSHQNPPILAESAQPGTVDIARLLAVMEANLTANARQMMQGMENKMEASPNGMKEQMKEMRGEMRQVGQCLQAGKRTTPCAGSNELKGSAPAGEDRVIRETCWARRVGMTEKVTVTQREKINGVTETCTSETVRQVTELTGTRETIEKRLHRTDGVEDAHTHRGSEGQWGRARRACWDPV